MCRATGRLNTRIGLCEQGLHDSLKENKTKEREKKLWTRADKKRKRTAEAVDRRPVRRRRRRVTWGRRQLAVARMEDLMRLRLRLRLDGSGWWRGRTRSSLLVNCDQTVFFSSLGKGGRGQRERREQVSLTREVSDRVSTRSNQRSFRREMSKSFERGSVTE